MKLPAREGNVFVPILIIAALAVGAALFFNFASKQQINNVPAESTPQAVVSDNLKTHTSSDLKISFSYPKDWFVDEKDFDIMITSYKTRIGENKEPNSNEIKIFIDNFNGCHATIEENLIDPACGEGGTKVKKNEIISKEVRETVGGKFYKYVIKTPNNIFTYYLLEGKNNILQIEKHPDPSQFESEFNQIIDSIRFLP